MDDGAGRHGFWVTNHLANPVLRPLLRGPLGRRWGRHLAVLQYRGRQTGRLRELVVQYTRDGDCVWIMPGEPKRKRWWRNMREPLPVELRLAGHDVHGIARVLQEQREPAAFADGLAAYRKAFPRVEGSDDNGVLVRVDIDRASGGRGAMPE